jgi:pilus assembly protein FimV
MIEFDLGSLSLDLEQEGGKADMTPPAQGVGSPTSADLDAMDTKLALAQEFHSIGDSDAARALVREVIAEASGPLKAKAQRFLAELG